MMMTVESAERQGMKYIVIVWEETFMTKMLPETVDMTPVGRVSDELSPEEFAPLAEQFFKDILEIHKADISEIILLR